MAAVRREFEEYDLDNAYNVDGIENGDVGEADTGSRMNQMLGKPTRARE